MGSVAVYRRAILYLDKIVPQRFLPLWHHPAGPKTIFFWAPAFKWGLVIAGISDLARPAEKISIQQSSSLAVTGVIWSRYSLVIIPKNWLGFSVNVFVALSGAFQAIRGWRYQQSIKGNNKM
ncbi:unnamed protein product [Orchesella dallaii]|uniref:Mitochondrial pyruvate carrier n=1 Tax=Orchesella dallaii TaxID=48710 RepID=A0ABP1R141_9HEXA